MKNLIFLVLGLGLTVTPTFGQQLFWEFDSDVVDLGQNAGRTWADFNGDGKADFIRIVDGNKIRITPSTGHGFGPEITTRVVEIGEDDGRVWADFNGDGKADFCRVINGTTLKITLSTGTGLQTTDISANNFSDAGWGPGRGWADFNGDKKADYCRTIGGNKLRVSVSNGNGLSSEYTSSSIDDLGWNEGRSWADFDGDGKADYCRSIGGDKLVINLSNGSSFGEQITTVAVNDLGWNDGRGWADFDGDGKADYCRSIGGDKLVVNLSNGKSGLGKRITSLKSTDLGWNSGRGWADFNGDGLADYCRTISKDGDRLRITLSLKDGFGSEYITPNVQLDVDRSDVISIPTGIGDNNCESPASDISEQIKDLLDSWSLQEMSLNQYKTEKQSTVHVAGALAVVAVAIDASIPDNCRLNIYVYNHTSIDWTVSDQSFVHGGISHHPKDLKVPAGYVSTFISNAPKPNGAIRFSNYPTQSNDFYIGFNQEVNSNNPLTNYDQWFDYPSNTCAVSFDVGSILSFRNTYSNVWTKPQGYDRALLTATKKEYNWKEGLAGPNTYLDTRSSHLDYNDTYLVRVKITENDMFVIIQDKPTSNGMENYLGQAYAESKAGKSLLDGIVFDTKRDVYYSFRGTEYSKSYRYEEPMSGYPKKISGNWTGWPTSWGSGDLDGIVFDEDQNVYYLFKGDEYTKHEWNKASMEGYPKKINSSWAGWPSSWGNGDLDAIYYDTNSDMYYLYKDDEYVGHKWNQKPAIGPVKIKSTAMWPRYWGDGGLDAILFDWYLNVHILFKGSYYAIQQHGKPPRNLYNDEWWINSKKFAEESTFGPDKGYPFTHFWPNWPSSWPKDATMALRDSGDGEYVSFQSSNYPDRYISTRSDLGWLELMIATTEDELYFVIQSGLEDPNGISVSNRSGTAYLRHLGYRIHLHPSDGTQLFKNDATFYKRDALDGSDGFSFESKNYPGYYIRHRNFELYIDQNDGTSLYKADASFKIIPKP